MLSSLELNRYQLVLRDCQDTSSTDETNVIDLTVEELRMSPLVWWNVKKHIEPQQQAALPTVRTTPYYGTLVRRSGPYVLHK
jgi:hypothetical protein